jgi:hypothetical protein
MSKKFFMLFAAILMFNTTTKPQTETNISFDKAEYAKAAIVASITIALYKLSEYFYSQFKQFSEETLTEEAANKIYIALMSQKAVKKLPTNEQEKILKEKARLINIRIRVLKKLEDKANNDPNLSPKHKATILSFIKKMRALFKVVDLVRSKNPYENDYTSASLVDKALEKKLIKSIISNKKPNSECTQQELDKKQKSKQRRTKMVAILKQKYTDNFTTFIQDKLDTLIITMDN